ncbi:hypothetical protein [Trinickia mobilis]|uniref:hypothetical protein n=1 Tax=Trinickia mobilis TaxID=2816356 RepID=UPI001A8C68E6|nr:hypothetical protein [Trinickia mobilis]
MGKRLAAVIVAAGMGIGAAGIGIGAVGQAFAAGDADGPQIAASDEGALQLADTANAAPSARSNWQRAFEFAAGNYTAASQTGSVLLDDTLRVSSSLAYDGAFAPGWRAVFSNQFDAGWRGGTGRYNAVDTLKEAYLSWRPNTSAIVDAGRINLREGVAPGFNPTDFFKAGALRAVTSIDPESLRENRLGSVMLRGQALWNGGSVTALVSPPLASTPSSATFNPDFGATNQTWRYMLSGTQRLFGGFAPQWLIYGGAGISPQFGVDATTLLDNATVGFLEYSGGRSSALAGGPQGPESFHSKLATGLTRTFPNKVSVTLEYDYDGASANRATWDALAAHPASFGEYLGAAASAQELPTRQSLFTYVTWQDAFVVHLDLTALGRYDLVDHSYFTWLEARYHWPRVDLAVQWQTNHGASHSPYGDAPQKQVLQGVLTFFY